jgi:hypothetical protein
MVSLLPQAPPATKVIKSTTGRGGLAPNRFLVPWLIFCTLFLLQPGVPRAAHLAAWIPSTLAHVLPDPHLPALHGARPLPLLPEPPAQAGNRMTQHRI